MKKNFRANIFKKRELKNRKNMAAGLKTLSSFPMQSWTKIQVDSRSASQIESQHIGCSFIFLVLRNIKVTFSITIILVNQNLLAKINVIRIQIQRMSSSQCIHKIKHCLTRQADIITRIVSLNVRIARIQNSCIIRHCWHGYNRW